GEGDDGPPAHRPRGAENEIELAPDARDLPAVHALGVDLAEQIYLEGGVDGYEVAEGAHHLRIVDEVRRFHVDHAIVVRPAEEPLRAHDLPHVHAPAVEAFARVGDHAGFDQ